MMRVIFLLLVSSIALQSKSQTWNNYLQKRFKSYGIWADSVLLLPSDTTINKAAKSLAVKNGNLYIANGTYWTEISGGSSGGISKTYADWGLSNVNDSTLKVDSSLIATRAGLYKVSDSISDKLNNKLNASAVSIGAGQVAFGSGTNTIGGDNGLYWDNTNKRLGIGTATPGVSLDIAKDFAVNDGLRLLDASGGYFQVTQSTSTAGAFQPVFQGLAKGNGTSALIFKGLQTTGTAPANGTVRFIARDSTDTDAISATDIAFRFDNNSTAALSILGNGNVGIGTASPSQKLHVVGNGIFTGTLKVGAYTLPSTDGSANQVLKTNGSGTLSWQNDSGISLTSLSATAPLSYNNGTGAFSISQANGSTNGYLSSTDWNTFNNKQTALGFTPENIANKKTTLSDNSDTYYPTQKAVKTAVDAKQDTITGGATTITSSNLTANRVLLSNGSGKVAVSSVTNTELGYVGGVTSSIQTQLNSKANTITEITKLELDSLITVNGLKTGQFYKISGVHPTLYGGTTIIMQAESTNKLVAQGHGIFYNPKYNESNVFKGIWNQGFMLGTFDSVSGNFDYENKETVTANNGATGKVYANGFIKWVSGDWSSVSSITGNSSAATADVSGFTTPTYSINSMVVWGGRVYKNKLGNLGNDEGNSPLDNGEWYSLNSSDWEVVGYEDENEYTKVIDVIRYDYANDLIIYRADNKGNEVECNYKDIIDIQDNYNGGINAIQLFQWGRESEDAFSGVYNNKIKLASFADIINNYGSIYSNTLTNSSSIYYNTLTNNSSIYFNTLTNSSSIYSNTLTNSSIYSNTLTNNSSIYSNTLTNSNIYYNTLTNSSNIYSNTLTNNSSIYSNTLTDSSIRYNTLTNSSIYSNTLTNSSSIYSNTLTNNSSIYFNTLTNSSEISMGTSNTLSNKNIQYNNFIRGSILNVSLSSATIVFGNFEKTIYKRSDGTTKIRYFNDSDVLIIANITD